MLKEKKTNTYAWSTLLTRSNRQSIKAKLGKWLSGKRITNLPKTRTGDRFVETFSSASRAKLSSIIRTLHCKIETLSWEVVEDGGASFVQKRRKLLTISACLNLSSLANRSWRIGSIKQRKKASSTSTFLALIHFSGSFRLPTMQSLVGRKLSLLRAGWKSTIKMVESFTVTLRPVKLKRSSLIRRPILFRLLSLATSAFCISTYELAVFLEWEISGAARPFITVLLMDIDSSLRH